MIQFRAGNPKRTLIRGLIAIAVGIAIFAVPGLTLKLIIQLFGALLLADGVINFAIYSLRKKTQPQGFILIPRGLASIIFGLVLLAFPAGMISIFVFLIGFVLIVAGGSQLLAQLGGRSLVGVSWVFILIAAIALLAGITLLVNPFESAEFMIKFFAAIIIIYGAGELFWSNQLRKIKTQQPNRPNEPTTIDAEYEEVE
jgi:membrane protein HdeD